jgi:ParB family chromosome partitioning protein
MAEKKGARPPKASADAQLAFSDPSKKQDLTFAIVPAERLEVITHQRKPSAPHVGKVTTSIEKVGFLTPLVVVEQDGKYVIIDGQHRFLAAQQLELKQLPVVIVPPELARRMLSLNVEKEPNIRERSAVALSIYRELVETDPDLAEEEPLVADSVDHAHYVTLGLGYEESARLAGSSFEPILRKCDGFLDQPLSKAYEIRQERAAKVGEANTLVRAVADKLKEIGAWHQFVGAQIIAYANPLKRTRKQASFDSTFEKMIDKLHELEEHPEKALRASGD